MNSVALPLWSQQSLDLQDDTGISAKMAIGSLVYELVWGERSVWLLYSGPPSTPFQGRHRSSGREPWASFSHSLPPTPRPRQIFHRRAGELRAVASIRRLLPLLLVLVLLACP
jgi:hypothetical protein